MISANIVIIVLGTLTVGSSAQVPSNDVAANHQGHNAEFLRDSDITVEEDNADFFKEDKEIQSPINSADQNDIDDEFMDVQLKELENKNFEDANETREDAETESASDNNYCPNYWHGFNNKCYRAYFSPKHWVAAHQYCQGRGSGGSLATSDSAQLNSFIAKHVAGRIQRVWIGLHDRNSEGDFHWVENNEHRHGFSAWVSGEPGNNYGGNEDCVEINYQNTNGYWNDHRCGVEHPFVCQIDEVDI